MDRNLIRKYFTQDCSPAEKQRLFSRLKKNPKLFTAEFSEDDWLLFAQSTVRAENDLEAQKLLDKVAARRKKRRSVIYKAVACAATLITVAYACLWYYNTGSPNAAMKQSTAGLAVLAPVVAYTNTSAAIQHIKLSDGTVVHLEPGSKISYKKGFEPVRREVFLDGTATFKVAKNPLCPFTVYCKEVATTALGTEFHVSSLSGKEISVKLIEGKIMVHAVKNGVTKKHYLLAGDAIFFNRDTYKFSTMADIEARTAHEKTIELERLSRKYFEGESLPKVLAYIENTYDIKVEYDAGQLSHIHFVGTLQRSEPVESMLQNIAVMNNLTLSKDTINNKVIFLLK